jgi:hypothetical protein
MRLSHAVLVFLASMGPAFAAEDVVPPTPSVVAPAPATPAPIPAVAAPTASASAATSLPGASKLPKPSEQIRFVPSGEKRVIGFFSFINPDCSSLGTTAHRVELKAEHGDVSFEETSNYATFPSGAREHCNAEKVPGLSIFYQSSPDYVGEDKVEVLLIFPTATASVIDYDLIVR